MVQAEFGDGLVWVPCGKGIFGVLLRATCVCSGEKRLFKLPTYLIVKGEKNEGLGRQHQVSFTSIIKTEVYERRDVLEARINRNNFVFMGPYTHFARTMFSEFLIIIFSIICKFSHQKVTISVSNND